MNDAMALARLYEQARDERDQACAERDAALAQLHEAQDALRAIRNALFPALLVPGALVDLRAERLGEASGAPWRLVGMDMQHGRPRIMAGQGEPLAAGYTTWEHNAELVVALRNALPLIVEELAALMPDTLPVARRYVSPAPNLAGEGMQV